MDQFYFEEGYIETGYFSYIAEANASLSVVADLTAAVTIADTTGYFIPDYIQEGYFVAGGVVQSASASLTVAATVNAVAGTIKETTVAIDGVMSFTATATAFKNHTAILDAQSSLSTDVNLTASAAVTLENLVNMSLQGDRIVDSAANLQVSAQITIDITQLELVEAALTSAASLTVAAQVANRRPRPYEVTNNPTINTANKQFGAGSLLQGDNNAVIYYDSTDYKAVKTIDFWYKPQTFLVNQNNTVYFQRLSDSTEYFYVTILRISDSGANTQWRVTARTRISGTNYNYTSAVITNWTDFKHIRIQRDGKLYLWVDGVKDTPAIDTSSGSYPNMNTALVLGRSYGIVGSDGAKGYIDELYVSKNLLINSSTSTFTPPTDAYQLSDTEQSSTILLGHYDVDFSDDVSEYLRTNVTLNANATLAVDANKTSSASSTLAAVATLTAAVAEIEQGASDISAVATLSSDPVKTASAEINISGAASFSINVDAINPGDAYLESAFTLSADAVKQIGGLIDATATATLSATVDQFIGIPATTISSAATVTADVIRNKGIITTLPVTSSLTVTANFKHLQLRNGGYIKTTTIDVENNLDDVVFTDGAPGFDGRRHLANFWLKLSRNLDFGETITLWRSSNSVTNPGDGLVARLTLRRCTGSEKISLPVSRDLERGAYLFSFIRYTDYANEFETPINYDTVYYTWYLSQKATVSGDVDFTQWHNVGIPWGGSHTIPGGGFDGSANNFYSGYLQSTLVDKRDTGTPYFRMNAGVWGHPDNTDVDVFISKLWIGDVDDTPESFISAAAFYNQSNNWEVLYGANGTVDFTYGNENQFNASATPLVFFDWEQGLNEGSSNAIDPEWDYAPVGNVQTGFILPGSASIDGAFTLDITPTWIVYGEASISSAAAVQAQPLRIKQLDSSLSSAADLSVDAVKLVITSANLSAAFAQDTTAVKTTDVLLDATVIANLTVDIKRTRDNEFDLDSQAQIDAINQRFRDPTPTEISAVASVDTSPVKIVSAEIIIDGVMSFSAVAQARRTAETQLNTSATLTTNPVKKTGNLVIIDAAFALTATAFNTVDYSADLAVTAAVAADNLRVRFNSADIDAVADIEIYISQIKGYEIDLQTVATVAATATRIQQNDSGLNIEASLTVDGGRVRFSSAELDSQFEPFYANAFRVVDAEVTLTAFVVTVTAGDVIAIDPFRTLLIPQETRRFKILEENRDLIIEQETRVLEI